MSTPFKILGLMLSIALAIVAGTVAMLGWHFVILTLRTFWSASTMHGASLMDAAQLAWFHTFRPLPLMQWLDRYTDFIRLSSFVAMAAFFLMFLLRTKPRNAAFCIMIAWTFFTLGSHSLPWQQVLLLIGNNASASLAICYSFPVTWKLGRLFLRR